MWKPDPIVEIKLSRLEPWPLKGAAAGSEVWNREICLGTDAYTLVRAQSGKGKTTLLSILYGLRRDYAGQVLFDSADIRHYGPSTWAHLRRERLSLVFQDLQLFEDLTAGQNAQLKNRLTAHKTPGEIDSMFEQLGMAEQANQPVARLSLGQQQRVAIVRALCQPFECLLLDEPFSHLDQENQEKAAALIAAECQRQGAGLIVTSLAPESPFPCPVRLSL